MQIVLNSAILYSASHHTISNYCFYNVGPMASNHKLMPSSGRARHIPKEKKLLNPVLERGGETKMLMHQARRKRRPRSDHGHASYDVISFGSSSGGNVLLVHVLKLCPFGLYVGQDVLNLV